MRHLGKEMFFVICVLLLLAQLQQTFASRHVGGRHGRYLPVMYKTAQPPSYVCYHTRKLCYVPSVSPGWRGWHRKGFSGYFIHNSWMYYISKVKCPCLFPTPPNPQGRTGSSFGKHQPIYEDK